MKGEQFVKIIEQLLAERGISKGEFYKAVGISATALYGWRRGAEPKRETIEAVEKYFGTSLNDIEKSDPREDLREDLRTLLRSAEDLSPSSVYELIAEIHRRKEMGKVDSSDWGVRLLYLFHGDASENLCLRMRERRRNLHNFS